jgi:hypothetical protein
MKRFASLAVAVGALSAGLVLTLSIGAASASHARASSSLPTLNVALTGTTGVLVSGNEVSGAVNVTSTFSGKAPSGPNSNGPSVGLFRLNSGATVQQVQAAINAAHGDLNALTPFGGIVVEASAPGTVQTVLTPGTWVALNTTGNGKAGMSLFTVTQSSSPAALPAAAATEKAIEFNFRGPSVLHNGTVVRAENGGFLVHMIDLVGVKSKSDGQKLIAALKAGQNKKARKLSTNSFVSLIGPSSPGSLQQEVLKTKPGYYVEACFMNTQDGREHTQLGMERLIKIAK